MTTARMEAREHLEEGTAFMDLVGPAARERFEVVVIGGGQAGLTAGHHLRKAGMKFVILDGAVRIGDVWRERWDSLRLFTPAKFAGLAGMRFPAAGNHFPTKDEMADYLEAYARRFELPVRTRSRVTRLVRQEGRYLVRVGDEDLEADRVIVAMADYQHRKVPAFASALSPEVLQLHSSDYRSSSQLREGGVLVVGAGNSGAEIALETARGGHRTFLSGRDVGQLPFRVDGFLGRLFLARLFLRVIFHRLLTVRTPIGRRARPTIVSRGGPLIRTKWKHLSAAGVERCDKTVGVAGGRPQLEDGRILDVSNVIWCTGFGTGFSSWIELPIFDESGKPRHEGGVVPEAPGLYFVGLHFLSALSSAMIHGVSRDAERIVRTIAGSR